MKLRNSKKPFFGNKVKRNNVINLIEENELIKRGIKLFFISAVENLGIFSSFSSNLNWNNIDDMVLYVIIMLNIFNKSI